MGKRFLIAVAVGVVLGGGGIVAAWLIPGNMGDTCFYIGIALVLVGVFALLKGAPSSGIGSFTGGPGTGAEVLLTAKAAVKENEPKKFRSNRVFCLNPAGVCLVTGGAINLVCSLTKAFANN